MLFIENPFPPMDIYETEESLVIEIDIPSIDINDVKLIIDGSKLTIEGIRNKTTPPGVRYHIVERYSGRFKRTIELPFTPANDGIKAVYKKGTLTVTISKRIYNIALEG